MCYCQNPGFRQKKRCKNSILAAFYCMQTKLAFFELPKWGFILNTAYFYSRGVSFLKWEGCQNCNNKKVEQIIIAEKENGQKLRHYWSAVRRSREWNKPLFIRKYAVCAFTPSPCIKRIWLQKAVKSKDFLTVIAFGKKGMSNRT